MLSVLFSLCLAADSVTSLMRDDTYHRLQLSDINKTMLYVQPSSGHSAIMVIHEAALQVSGFKQEGEQWIVVDSDLTERSSSWTETRFVVTGDDPTLFALTASSECWVAVNHVHTDTVYRVSIVLGAFGMFICLFLFIFSWTIFCGACRATRKR